MTDGPPCRICGSETTFIGTRAGRIDGRLFKFCRCSECNFSFVENYRSDFENIYNEDYYRGKGGDPMVDYVYENENPGLTIRFYEYRGLCQIFSTLCPTGGKWLDFGCGGGGLVRYARQRSLDVVGSEDGWAADLGRSSGIPILTSQELDSHAGSFDFVTAIEVFEHIADPLEAFKKIRSLLKPGGKLFLTTGNAAPWSARLLEWGYTHAPDVHISFFEPGTLRRCLRETGFVSAQCAFNTGFKDIIKYKVLKNIGLHDRSMFLDILPWYLISKIVDYKYQITGQPYGVAGG
ncbi:class I SAM-dependent methyltransferase [Rhizobium sp. 2YAF20]|uniref:class I SAM-dependent methyltransferase n=1 Tax=Rhizobium sp. 2YAF20 TaxID=3233027 RepID=UPI003F9ACC53